MHPPALRRATAGAMLALVALVALVVLAACNGAVRVPEPSVGRAAPLPPARPAVLAIPVTIALGVVRQQLDLAFPPADSLDRARCSALGGVVCHQYVYRRDPLELRLDGDRFGLATRLRYRGRVAMTRVATLGSCGYGGEGMRRAELRFATTLYWRSDWALASRDTELGADLLDPCRVTALNLDATPLMRRIVDAQLRDLTRMADSLIPAVVDLGPVADSLWRELQRPVALDSDGTVWLAMGVERASLAPLVGDGAVRTAVVLTARPRVVLGVAPPATARPLPALTLSGAAPGLRIPVDVHLPFADLAARSLALMGPEAAADGIVVHDVRLWGAGDTLVVGMDISGKLAGTFYLLGRVRYDAAARVVRIDDLRWTVESEGMMTRLKATLGAPLIRRALNRATGGGRLNVGAQLDSARSRLTQLLNRPVASGMHVGGGITDVRIVGLHLTADAIVVRVELDGTARLIVQ